ncbi:hypothetical protein [Erythrobacter sp. MTPC3]|uniref:hypothetical protein n=1 Tax=Erythrobacter sp. MTPC3 TaxID=3056564 RepID=UPI0036F3D3D7
MNKPISIRLSAAGLLAGLFLLLSGCFITPGKFTSELVLSDDETFAFSYEGEIFFLGLSSLAQMQANAEEFSPEECYDEETFETRDCTEAELEQQRADWDAGADARAAEAKQQAEQMAAMTGGIDPNDPEATAELTRMLLRQNGWNRVEAKGDGVFDVSFSVTGKITHDFMFPVIEEIPTTSPFVQMFIRNDNVVRINAPGFAAQGGDNSAAGMMGGMLGGMAGIAAMGGEDASENPMANLPQVEGTFTVRSEGQMRILANNTDEGPMSAATGEVLSWDISPRTAAAPTALIAVGR